MSAYNKRLSPCKVLFFLLICLEWYFATYHISHRKLFRDWQRHIMESTRPTYENLVEQSTKLRDEQTVAIASLKSLDRFFADALLYCSATLSNSPSTSILTLWQTWSISITKMWVCFPAFSQSWLLTYNVTQCPDPRLREILKCLTTHLHNFARETNLSSEEWM